VRYVANSPASFIDLDGLEVARAGPPNERASASDERGFFGGVLAKVSDWRISRAIRSSAKKVGAYWEDYTYFTFWSHNASADALDDVLACGKKAGYVVGFSAAAAAGGVAAVKAYGVGAVAGYLATEAAETGTEVANKATTGVSVPVVISPDVKDAIEFGARKLGKEALEGATSETAGKVAKEGLQDVGKVAPRTFLTKQDFSALPRTGTIDPSKIRFSQNSISATFKEGGTVSDLAAKLKAGTVDPCTIPPIRIVERNGQIFTPDNRRLKAFQEAGIPIRYEKLDAIPQREMFKFTTTNEGVSIDVRGQ
jgi:hypothetical protein